MHRLPGRLLILLGTLLLVVSVPGLVIARQLRRMYLDDGVPPKNVWMALAGGALVLAGLARLARAARRKRKLVEASPRGPERGSVG